MESPVLGVPMMWAAAKWRDVIDAGGCALRAIDSGRCRNYTEARFGGFIDNPSVVLAHVRPSGQSRVGRAARKTERIGAVANETTSGSP